jgi:hypothetical protein
MVWDEGKTDLVGSARDKHAGEICETHLAYHIDTIWYRILVLKVEYSMISLSLGRTTTWCFGSEIAMNLIPHKMLLAASRLLPTSIRNRAFQVYHGDLNVSAGPQSRK